ncbi:MAG: NAD(P)-dependent oxidoreductase [Alphaproteobacteria bacterium]|nr:NAD(P)-dependent oxidoreductase [Alphaproteobacteria bacterium]
MAAGNIQGCKGVVSVSRERVGWIGVGLMGHGAAKNILEKGHPLVVRGNRDRAPVGDLVARGAREARDLCELAASSDVVFLCVPGPAEVERVILGDGGLLAALRPGMALVDATTSDPNLTRRLGAELAARGVVLVDGPLGRTPLQAEAGKLSTFLGGEPEAVARVKPIVACYADTIIDAGPLGAGHTLKLCNNFISLGTAAVVSEAVATAAKLGVDLAKLHEVVSAGGANSAMFQMIMPWVLEGDDSKLRGPFRIGGKDLRTYCRLAEAAPFAAFMAQAASQIFQLANARGHGERMIPTLPGILADLNGAKIRDLD